MINAIKRKDIAKKFLCATFGFTPELWKNYDSNDENGKPRSWCPIPCPFISPNEEPFIGVGETFEEIKEIAKKELPEERLSMVDYAEFVYVDGKTYWVAID